MEVTSTLPFQKKKRRRALRGSCLVPVGSQLRAPRIVLKVLQKLGADASCEDIDGTLALPNNGR